LVACHVCFWNDATSVCLWYTLLQK
jgi:hypothetical protein